MSVTIGDVRHIAMLARLGLDDARAEALVGQLNTILEHMQVLSKVDTTGVEPMAAIGSEGLPLRPDEGPSVPLAHALERFVPQMRDGFIVVPRLSTHEDPEEA